MSQSLLAFKYEEEKKTTGGMPALDVLPLYLDLSQKPGLSNSIDRHLQVRKNAQGWPDSQMVLSLILLTLAGGTCVDDLKVLEVGDGFCEILSPKNQAVDSGRFGPIDRHAALPYSFPLKNDYSRALVWAGQKRANKKKPPGNQRQQGLPVGALCTAAARRPSA